MCVTSSVSAESGRFLASIGDPLRGGGVARSSVPRQVRAMVCAAPRVVHNRTTAPRVAQNRTAAPRVVQKCTKAARVV